MTRPDHDDEIQQGHETELGTVTDTDTVTADLQPITAELVVTDSSHPMAGVEATVQIAHTFIDQVKSGASLTSAAKAAGTSLSQLKRDSKIMAYIRSMAEDYKADADETRQFVWLKWLEIAMTTADPKERMVALRELSEIPEVGLKTPRTGQLPSDQLRSFSPDTVAALATVEDK